MGSLVEELPTPIIDPFSPPRPAPVPIRVKSMICSTKRVIEQYGWIQNSMGNVSVGFCLLGALNQAAIEEGYDTLTRDHAANILSFAAGAHGLMSIPVWNDRPERTKQDVLNLLGEFCA